MKAIAFKVPKLPKKLQSTVDMKAKALIAELCLQGKTFAEISDFLEEKGITKIDGKAITSARVKDYIAEAELEWRECYYKDISTHRNRLIKELQLVRKKAWEDGHLKLVVSTISEEAKMLGIGGKNGVETEQTGQKLIGNDEQQVIANLLREAVVAAAARGIKLPSSEITDADFRDITGEEEGNLDTPSQAVAGNTESSG